MSAGDELVQALGRFGEILQRADAEAAELVEINENANADEPAEMTAPSDVDEARADLWCEINELCNMYAGYTYCSREFTRQERAVNAAIDSLLGKCGHA